jgi:NADH-quinone oxidoreductase subunit M
VIVAFANVALPLTNSFIGEFMLFHGIFQSANPHHITYMIIAGLGIILGAVYMLNMVQKIGYGEARNGIVVEDAHKNELIGLVIIIALILVIGVYPNFIFGLLA